MPKKFIIWDWNGTLLDDMQICIDGINQLLRDRSVKELTPGRYRDIFTFPVMEYYRTAGFDLEKEPFAFPARQFINLYREKLGQSRLFPDATSTLQYFKDKGYTQAILSAMEQELLDQTTDKFGIRNYFTAIQGINDHYAHSKVAQARSIIKTLEASPENITYIGDTIHDHEVGLETGCEVILVSHGHQSEERLLRTGRKVVGGLRDLTDSFPAEHPVFPPGWFRP